MNKDSLDVIKFMSVFQKLKEWSDDDAQALAELAGDDDGVKQLCVKLYEVVGSLRQSERNQRNLFTAPVDPKFIAAWREFEMRFEPPLHEIWNSGWFKTYATKEEADWANADLNAAIAGTLSRKHLNLPISKRSKPHQNLG